MPDYYTLLLQKITEAESDPAKLRELVYGAARLALKRHVNVHYPAVSVQDGKRLITDLEAAIERLETSAGGAVSRPTETVTPADKAAALFEAPAQASQEFDFRAAYEGRYDERAADPTAEISPSNTAAAPSTPAAAPAAPAPELSDRAVPRNRDGDSTIPEQRDDARPAFTTHHDGTRPNPAPRPNNRFSGDRRHESRSGFASTRRGTLRRSTFERHEDAQPSVSHSLPLPAQDPDGPREWLDDPRVDRPAARELVLLPDPALQARRGAAYLVRPDGFPVRADEYFRDPPPPPKSPLRATLIAAGIVSQIAIVLLAAAALYVAVWGRPSPSVQEIAAATTGAPAKAPPLVLPAARPAPPADAPDSTMPAAATTAAIAPTPAAAMPSFPRPTAYGVYAISDNRLIELEPIATAPVDPRTRSTVQITKPSRTLIVDPKLTFVAFRRDLISTAPDKVPVRVAAKIAKQMTFDSTGKAVTGPPPTETWLVREQGYDLRVSPVRETPEMVLMRPDGEGFAFPPGRYTLVLGTQSYDFVIAGDITDPAQCVEGVATARGPAFYECRTQ